MKTEGILKEFAVIGRKLPTENEPVTPLYRIADQDPKQGQMKFLFAMIMISQTSAVAFARTEDEVLNLIKSIKHVENVPCSSTTYCQDGQHCCFYSTGQPAGCCPDGETCDVSAGLCRRSNEKNSTPGNHIVKIQHSNNVPCSSTTYCQDGQHCCFYSTGQPAGCCADGKTCDVSAGVCRG